MHRQKHGSYRTTGSSPVDYEQSGRTCLELSIMAVASNFGVAPLRRMPSNLPARTLIERSLESIRMAHPRVVGGGCVQSVQTAAGPSGICVLPRSSAPGHALTAVCPALPPPVACRRSRRPRARHAPTAGSPVGPALTAGSGAPTLGSGRCPPAGDRPRRRRRHLMRRSSERILTTHTGSLPRPSYLLDVMTGTDEAARTDAVRRPVSEVVARQIDSAST